jgi:hypothetical protein
MMRASLDEGVPQPTPEQLRSFFQENRDRYRQAESITFEQVFFRADSDAKPANPEELLARLRTSDDFAQLGEVSPWSGSVVRQATQRYLRAAFGPEFAEQVFKAATNQWFGPTPSRQGDHYVRVREHHPGSDPPFEESEYYVRQDWEIRQRRRIQSEKIAEMLKSYRVDIQKPQPASTKAE